MTVTPIAELEELLPCPFCGGESKLEDATRITGLWRLFHRCTVLPGTFGVVMGETAGDCVRKWNTRAESSTLSTLSARVEELEAGLQFYADESAWNQPPVKVHRGLLCDEYENQASKVRWDRGRIARALLTKDLS